jgi:hypothetical protein
MRTEHELERIINEVGMSYCLNMEWRMKINSVRVRKHQHPYREYTSSWKRILRPRDGGIIISRGEEKVSLTQFR